MSTDNNNIATNTMIMGKDLDLAICRYVMERKRENVM